MITAHQHDCKDELQALDLRATPARITILRLLEDSKNPVDAASILDHLKKEAVDTDPATVFRIMNTFTQKGIANPIAFQEGKMRYELASKEDHHHLICEQCGRVDDIEDNVIPGLEKHIESHHHFQVKRHALEFFGLCEDCQIKEKLK